MAQTAYWAIGARLVFYRLVYPVCYAVFYLLARFHPKAREGFRDRKNLIDRIPTSTHKPYWFHFSSAGELEQALPIVEALRRKVPGCTIHLSYFSPSAHRALKQECARRQNAQQSVPWTSADYLCFDFPWSVKTFLRKLDPVLLALIHQEYWPELLEQCRRRKIPVYSFASTAGDRKTRFFFRPWIERFAFLGTGDSHSAAVLTQHFSRLPVAFLGNPRHERVLSRKTFATPIASFPSPVFIAASIWPEDFEALRLTLKALTAQAWSFLLVPHEPIESFLRQMEKTLHGQGIACTRWNQRTGSELPPVLIVNSVGQLAELYQKAEIAFVGGSFRRRVHNVLEPAAHRLPIVTGPFIENSAEALQMQVQGGLLVASSPVRLQENVEKLVQSRELRKQIGQRAFGVIEQNLGAAQRYCDVLLENQPL